MGTHRRWPIEPELRGREALREPGEPECKPLPNVCTTLREARSRSGYQLSDVASVLRIQLAHLEALEDGRFDELPGKTYAVGFLRSYAGFLGLNSEEVILSYKRELALDLGHQHLSFPGPAKEGPRPRPWLFVVVLIVAGLAYGGWHYFENDGNLSNQLVSDVSDRLSEAAGLSDSDDTMLEPELGTADFLNDKVSAEILGEASAANHHLLGSGDLSAISKGDTTEEVMPAPEAPRDLTENEFLEVDSLNTGDEPLETSPLKADTEVRITRTALGATASGREAEYIPKVFGSNKLSARIVIKAVADSWIQIQGPNNELLITRIFRAGDEYRVPDRSDLVMITGNAGGLEIIVDGEIMGPVGPWGAVRRNVVLDPDRLTAGGVFN